MATYYQAAVQVPRKAGFWCPHTEWQYDNSPRLSSLAECMHWLANNELSYEKNADSYVDVVVNGHIILSWEFTKGRCITIVA